VKQTVALKKINVCFEGAGAVKNVIKPPQQSVQTQTITSNYK
jgi:hypothetical protein